MMLDDIWDQFLLCISSNDEIKDVSNKLICGVIFLYIQPLIPHKSEAFIKNILLTCSKQYTLQYKLLYRVEFVRVDQNIFVFRHRFYVPNQKMFCCGNKCSNCTRFRK